MRNLIISLLIIAAVALGAWRILDQHPTEHSSAHDHEDTEVETEYPKGPRGGRLFRNGSFAIELVLYETGVPPEFHAYAYQDDTPLSPETVDLTVELSRLGGRVDSIPFQPMNERLRGVGIVVEPHSFDVRVQAFHQGKEHVWTFSSHEGRTTIPAELAREAGIGTAIAGPATITETLALTGRVQLDPARLAEVRARFPGAVQSLRFDIGETVKKGDTLATVQSNESLQNYRVSAPIDGVILQRNTQIGAGTGETPLFLIADLSQVWVELDVFGRDLGRVRAGQAVEIQRLDGTRLDGEVSYVSPLAQHASQSVQARVVLDNSTGMLRPGQFVRGRVIIAEHPVELAVPPAAIQAFRDFQVVYALFGDTYEVRMLDLGRSDANWVEVLRGLEPGTEYVDSNSYLIKADIEKSGASHDH